MSIHTLRGAVVAPLAAGLLAGCSGDARTGRWETTRAVGPLASDTMPPPAAVERARSAANSLGKDLQSKLFGALDAGGPANAIGICADSAQVWSARHAGEGVTVRRVSLRVRNPKNRPDSLEERELRRLDSLHRTSALPGEVVRYRLVNGERLVEYARPIMVQERCLACHGPPEQIAPAIQRILSERYPGDQATGYRAGDFRGMISVRVKP